MNKLTIIGNLTRDPELRTTSTGINVCSFTVAVNRRRSSQNANQPEADFFRVSAWRQLGENCQRFLAKGRKVAVVGPVSVSSYTGSDGSTRFSLEVTADDVEFLSSRQDDANFTPSSQGSSAGASPMNDASFQEVDDDDLPF
ncbi:MAG: single-stranded DNA-binding protein [Clostridiales bacterium]|nr:single-stranded DNA-binding protein [Clostridiales bacterium]